MLNIYQKAYLDINQFNNAERERESLMVMLNNLQGEGWSSSLMFNPSFDYVRETKIVVFEFSFHQ